MGAKRSRSCAKVVPYKSLGAKGAGAGAKSGFFNNAKPVVMYL